MLGKLKHYYDCRPGVIAILCRHGATKANDDKVPLVRGWEDFELDDNGKMEAQLLGHKLRQYGIAKIVSSDFIRDAQTANIISNIVKTNDLETDFDLRTWDVGTFSGKPLALVNPAIEEIYKTPWRRPEGGSETFNEFSQRVIRCLDKWLTIATIDIYRPILLVTHGKNIAYTKTYIDGGNAWESIMPKPAGCAIISVEPDRSLSIEVIPPYENVIEDI